jgi:hypothetical protein
VVDGEIVNLNRIPEFANQEKIKKTYKITAEESQRNTLAKSIINRIALVGI